VHGHAVEVHAAENHLHRHDRKRPIGATTREDELTRSRLCSFAEHGQGSRGQRDAMFHARPSCVRAEPSTPSQFRRLLPSACLKCVRDSGEIMARIVAERLVGRPRGQARLHSGRNSCTRLVCRIGRSPTVLDRAD
jgi:hypothetical protein